MAGILQIICKDFGWNGMFSKLAHTDSNIYSTRPIGIKWDEGHRGMNQILNRQERKAQCNLLHGKPVTIPYNNVNTDANKIIV